MPVMAGYGPCANMKGGFEGAVAYCHANFMLIVVPRAACVVYCRVRCAQQRMLRAADGDEHSVLCGHFGNALRPPGQAYAYILKSICHHETYLKIFTVHHKRTESTQRDPDSR
jgi:hypothetical protein